MYTQVNKVLHYFDNLADMDALAKVISVMNHYLARLIYSKFYSPNLPQLFAPQHRNLLF